MRVLIIKTSSMGDILHTLPALTDAMQVIFGIRFDWVIEESFAQIPEWHPAVDRIIPVAIRRWRKHWFGRQQREERVGFKRELQTRQYDAVIDAQGLIKSAALVTRLAKGVKHGHNSRSAREPFASWWYDKRHDIDKRQHAVERTRQLFAKSLGYEKPITPGNYHIAAHILSELQADTQPYIVFLHATTRTSKHWPEGQWQALIAVMADSGLRIKLPWGTEQEHQLALRLAHGYKHVDVLEKLTLKQMACILAAARAVVSVDTGLSHLTAALDRPNITLYGPTDPHLIGGYGEHQHKLISENSNNMAGISVPVVATALKKLLSTSPGC